MKIRRRYPVIGRENAGMRMSRGYAALFFIVILPAVHTGSYAQDDGDWQLWVQETITGKPCESWAVEGKQEFRFGDDMEEFISNRTTVGVQYTHADWISMSLNYKQIYDSKEGTWREENRPQFDITFKWTILISAFENRNRLEYRIIDDTEKSWRYRNRLTIAPDVKLTGVQFQPYMADEIFVDFEADELSRNRLYIGFKAKWMKHLKSSLYYLWQSSKKGDEWIDFNVIGVDVKFAF